MRCDETRSLRTSGFFGKFSFVAFRIDSRFLCLWILVLHPRPASSVAAFRVPVFCVLVSGVLLLASLCGCDTSQRRNDADGKDRIRNRLKKMQGGKTQDVRCEMRSVRVWVRVRTAFFFISPYPSHHLHRQPAYQNSRKNIKIKIRLNSR